VVEFRPSLSWPRLTVGDDGTVIGPSGKALNAFPDKRGYLRVNTYEGGKWTQLAVHFLVCEAYHGPRPTGLLVAHGDGDPANNAARNLRWATHAENEADKRAHGRSLLGERHHRAKLSDEQVREIRRKRLAGDSLKALSREYEVAESTISSIFLRKTWGHIQ